MGVVSHLTADAAERTGRLGHLEQYRRLVRWITHAARYWQRRHGIRPEPTAGNAKEWCAVRLPRGLFSTWDNSTTWAETTVPPRTATNVALAGLRRVDRSRASAFVLMNLADAMYGLNKEVVEGVGGGRPAPHDAIAPALVKANEAISLAQQGDRAVMKTCA